MARRRSEGTTSSRGSDARGATTSSSDAHPTRATRSPTRRRGGEMASGFLTRGAAGVRHKKRGSARWRRDGAGAEPRFSVRDRGVCPREGADGAVDRRGRRRQGPPRARTARLTTARPARRPALLGRVGAHGAQSAEAPLHDSADAQEVGCVRRGPCGSGTGTRHQVTVDEAADVTETALACCDRGGDVASASGRASR